MEAYCMKCKKQVGLRILKKSLPRMAPPPRMVKGTCSVCGTKVNKFLPTKRLDAVSTYDAM